MRLLLPHLDRARPAYGMKEVAMARHYIDILNIAKGSVDAQKLLHYRAPHAAKQVCTIHTHINKSGSQSDSNNLYAYSINYLSKATN